MPAPLPPPHTEQLGGRVWGTGARVRAEGEQFLLQARDVAGVIDWIEVSQVLFMCCSEYANSICT